MHILIADANPGMRHTIASIVRPIATHLFECSDAAMAVATCQAMRPDWAIIDFDLTAPDGLEACRRIAGTGTGTRVLLLTTHDDPAFARAAIAAGAAACVAKHDLTTLTNTLTAFPPLVRTHQSSEKSS